jgi:hypothetical protein
MFYEDEKIVGAADELARLRDENRSSFIRNLIRRELRNYLQEVSAK